MGIKDNTSLKEASFHFSTVVKKVHQDALSLHERLKNNEDEVAILHEAMRQLTCVDSITNCMLHYNARGHRSRLRVDQLMQLAGVPYITYVEFYIGYRNKALQTQDETKKNMELVNLLMRSTDYLLTMCNCLETAIARNDELPFKVT